MVERLIGEQTRVVVTGGAGFIGSHLVEQLVSLNAQVTVIDNLATGRLENLAGVSSKINLIQDELVNVLRTNQVALSNYDYVFHLAANPYIPPSVENPVYDFQANLHTTFLLLESMRACSSPPRLINASSAAVYGNPVSLPIRETDPTVPISPYGVSKLAAERYIAVYSQIYGLTASSLRFFSVYGPRQRKQVVFDLISKLRADPQHLQLLGDGSQERDFAYVLDVARALILVAIAAPGRGEAYNIASGITYTIHDLVQTYCRLRGLNPQTTYTGHVRPGDAEKWVVDISEIKQIGFAPQTTLEMGLQAIQEWYDAHF